MMYTILLDQELIRRGYRTIQQKADACGLEYEIMRQLLKGKHPSDERIIEIGQKLKLTDEKIAEMVMAKVFDKAKEPEQKSIIRKGMDSLKEKKPAQVGDEPAYIPEEKVTIPVYNTIKAGNGEMGITDGEPSGDTINIDDDYRKQKVFALRVSGDSMSPELYSGEIAIFKPINGEPLRDKDIYAVEIEGWSSWVVKFVRQDPSGSIFLVSSNPAYPVKEIDPKQSRVTLRGRLLESRRVRK